MHHFLRSFFYAARGLMTGLFAQRKSKIQVCCAPRRPERGAMRLERA